MTQPGAWEADALLLRQQGRVSNFSFCHNVLISSIIINSFLPWCFQNRLLQICCVWERVKQIHIENTAFLKKILLISFYFFLVDSSCHKERRKTNLFGIVMSGPFFPLSIYHAFLQYMYINKSLKHWEEKSHSFLRQQSVWVYHNYH